jgi:2-polyprenyl-3-methyl-5-hydroxy-6-metoxy-1,4-benzoquinol methylase
MAHTSNRGGEAESGRGGGGSARIGVLIIAPTAPVSIAALRDGLPNRLHARITEVFLSGDDHRVAAPGLGGTSPADHPPLVIQLAPQAGDGDVQKAALRLAAEHGLGILVVLRGAGAHVPEALEQLVAPLDRGECDAVIGRRAPSANVDGRDRTPAWRRAGSAVLTKIDRMLATQLSDPHSGWRAYDLDALASIPYQGNAVDGHFDLQVTLQLIGAGKRVVEVPLPPLRGHELGTAEALHRASYTSMDVLRVRLAGRGYLSGHLGRVPEEYGLKHADNSSHSIVLRWIGQMPAGRALDLGCSSGLLSERVRALGHRVTGVDMSALTGVTQRVDRFVQADLDRGLPPEVGEEGPFDLVIAADVLEHVRDPERLLRQVHSLMAPRGTLIASVPNFGHWYPRIRTAVGLFDYDQRGILDRGHVRFFTRRGLLDLVRRSGFTVTRQQATGLPLEVLSEGDGVIGRGLRAVDRAAVGVWPTLFGYQFVIRCETPPLVWHAQGSAVRPGATGGAR